MIKSKIVLKKNDYNFPPERELKRIREKEGIVNIVPSETTPVEEKIKYSVSQSILNYQQENKKTFKTLVKEIDIRSLTEKKLIDICRGKLNTFSLGELVIYANNLRITDIPCYNCGVNLFPSLLEAIISSLKKRETLPLNVFYQAHTHRRLSHY